MPNQTLNIGEDTTCASSDSSALTQHHVNKPSRATLQAPALALDLLTEADTWLHWSLRWSCSPGHSHGLAVMVTPMVLFHWSLNGPAPWVTPVVLLHWSPS